MKDAWKKFNHINPILLVAPFLMCLLGFVNLIWSGVRDWMYLYYSILLLVWVFLDAKDR